MFDYLILSAAVVIIAALYVCAEHIKTSVTFYMVCMLSLIGFFALVNIANRQLAKAPPKIHNPVTNKIETSAVKKITVKPIEEKVDELSDKNREENRSAVERFRALPNKND